MAKHEVIKHKCRKNTCRVMEIKARPTNLFSVMLEDRSSYLVEADEIWTEEKVLEFYIDDKIVAAFKNWSSYQLLPKVEKKSDEIKAE